jgi:hypothetical protein
LLIGFSVLQAPAIAVEPAKPESITAASVLELIKTKGPRPALQLVWDDTPKWTAIWNGIASGDANWLKVAVEFRPVSDAGSSEMLHSAVSLALVQAPERVLSLPEKLFPLAGACTYLPYDVPEYGNHELLNRKERAVRAMANPTMQDKKEKCLASLEEGRKELKALERENQ